MSRIDWYHILPTSACIIISAVHTIIIIHQRYYIPGLQVNCRAINSNGSVHYKNTSSRNRPELATQYSYTATYLPSLYIIPVYLPFLFLLNGLQAIHEETVIMSSITCLTLNLFAPPILAVHCIHTNFLMYRTIYIKNAIHYKNTS